MNKQKEKEEMNWLRKALREEMKENYKGTKLENDLKWKNKKN